MEAFADVVRGEGHVALRRRSAIAHDELLVARRSTSQEHPTTPVTKRSRCQGTLIAAVVTTMIVTIFGMMGIGLRRPTDAGKADIRDKEIDRFG